MAITRGPKIVRNGLVLALDAADRNSLPLSNLILNPSTASSYSANQNVTISQDGQYVKTVSNQAASTPGAWPIGGIITVESNTTYLFGIKAKRVSTPTPNFYITNGSNTQILYTISTLTSSTSYTWSYITFNSGANTSVKVGFLWSGPQIGSELSVETVILTKFNTWNDLSGNLDNGVLTNSPNFNNDNGGSIVFDGVDDNINVAPTNFNLSTFSINLWFKTNDITTNYLRLIHKADTTGATKGFLIANSAIDGKLCFVYQPNYITGEILKRSTTIITTSTWYNVVMTYNSSDGIAIYFNGNLDSGETSTSPDVGWVSSTGNLFSIGSRAGGGVGFFNGNIANVCIYDRALTASEVLQNYNTQKSRFGL